MKLLCLTRSVYKDYGFVIHRADCRDIAKTEEPLHGAMRIGEADTIKEAMALILDEEITEMGFTTNDVKVFPCCKAAD